MIQIYINCINLNKQLIQIQINNTCKKNKKSKTIFKIENENKIKSYTENSFENKKKILHVKKKAVVNYEVFECLL